MGLLDGFEKLINEHGSAAILRERIALANDKYAALEQKLKDSDARCADLVADNARLRTDLDSARAQIEEIRRLQNEADKQRQQEVANSDGLPTDRLRVLQAICFRDDMQAAQIAATCKLAPQVAEWHIDQLRARRLIDIRITAGSSWTGERGYISYTISPAGRNILAERDLLTPG